MGPGRHSALVVGARSPLLAAMTPASSATPCANPINHTRTSAPRLEGASSVEARAALACPRLVVGVIVDELVHPDLSHPCQARPIEDGSKRSLIESSTPAASCKPSMHPEIAPKEPLQKRALAPHYAPICQAQCTICCCRSSLRPWKMSARTRFCVLRRTASRVMSPPKPSRAAFPIMSH